MELEVTAATRLGSDEDAKYCWNGSRRWVRTLA